MDEKRTILFVDDEVMVLDCLQWGLRGEPYECLFATSGRQALDLFEKHEIHVICSDMQMPDMNGLELLKTVKERYPHTVRLVLSGNTQVGTLLAAINQGEIFKFITKYVAPIYLIVVFIARLSPSRGAIPLPRPELNSCVLPSSAAEAWRQRLGVRSGGPIPRFV